jgi:beta-glucosidase
MSMKNYVTLIIFLLILAFSALAQDEEGDQADRMIDSLIGRMTLQEKIGQMSQVHSPGGNIQDPVYDDIRSGLVGSILNETDPAVIRKMQEIAVKESRLGIPLIFARDVIHGFDIIFPVNIGQAATFNTGLIEETARAASAAAWNSGVTWNFAPMVDVSRDPRWGRMAESFGEDPLLVTEMGLAIHRGFIYPGPGQPGSLATTAKHFAGYGAVEGGRDYNTVSIPRVDLYNVHFRPFHALVQDNVASFMTAFNELNGIPASGNRYLFREVLRDEWGFEGVVVSDWASIHEMILHGYASGPRDAALKAIRAGVDMEMASTTYRDHLADLVKTGEVGEDLVNEAVRRILKMKLDLGLFEYPFPPEGDRLVEVSTERTLALAKETALQSIVLLKNKDDVLPLSGEIKKLAVIGPMAHDRYEQLGTWIFDGDTNLTVTPLMAIVDLLGADRVLYEKGLKNTRALDVSMVDRAVEMASQSDAVACFVGEESILTGEAHSRAYLDLPGAQNDLVKALARTGKPLVLVVMTSRPLTIGAISEYADAVLYAWHPGTMGGPAIADLLFGLEVPSGKLPVTFPKAPGQIPIYYAHKNTGRPPAEESLVKMEDIPERTFQTSLGNTSHYLDIGFEPLYPFGYGLSYNTYAYSGLELSATEVSMDDTLVVRATVTNHGKYRGTEIVQLYVRDWTASITRPVRELKGFKRLVLSPGESKEVTFSLVPGDLAFYNETGELLIEPGHFSVWIGPDSSSGLKADFELKPGPEPENQ